MPKDTAPGRGSPPPSPGPERPQPSLPGPLNPLPPVVVALFLIIAGVEAVLGLGARGIIGGPFAAGWRIEAIERFSFFPQLLARDLALGLPSVDVAMRLFTYPFVQASFTQALFVGVFLLALGKLVGEVMGTLAFLVVFFGSAIGGALFYALVLGAEFPVIGGFPAVYGLIGGYTLILWVSLGRAGQNQYRAFTLIGLLLLVQLVFGLLFGARTDWVADLGGFLSGFVLSILAAPGAVRAILRRIRRG